MLGNRFDDVLRRAKSGDPLAFGELWRDAQPTLLRYLMALNVSDPEDVASQTWLKVIDALTGFTGDEPAFRRWLVVVARHQHLDGLRRSRRRPVAVPLETELVDAEGGHRDGDPAHIVVENMSTEAAMALIARLPADQAELITLRVVAGMSVGDLVEITGRSPGAIRVAVHRALRRLQVMVEQDRACNDDEPDGVPGVS